VSQRRWGVVLIVVALLVVVFYALLIPAALVAGGIASIPLLAIGAFLIAGRFPR
jgi:hypothetical protein